LPSDLIENPCRITVAGRYCRRVIVGYAPVSTAEQNPDHQVNALLGAGVDRENIDVKHASGAKATRPRVARALPEGAASR
jgi:DNA invertase Pin-like site-specific DNA recombinase